MKDLKDTPPADDGKTALKPSRREKFQAMSDEQLRRYARLKVRLGGGVEAGCIEEMANRIGKDKS